LDQLNIFSIFKENVDLKGAIDNFREENDSNKNLSLEQQLMKLNSITSNHIEWNLDSSKIVDPKKVKVFRLEKSKFLKNPLVFEKLKNKKNSSLARQIVKRFGLFTIKTTEFCSPKETLNLIKQKNEQYNKNQELKIKINEMKQILDDYKDEVAKNFLPVINDSNSDANMSSTFFITSTSSTSEYEPYKNTLTFRGHIDRVTTLEFDEKNKRIISSSAAFNIKIWDIISGKCLHTFYSVHNDSINVMKLFHNGKYLVTGSDDHTIKILSLDEEEWFNNPYAIRRPGRVLALAVYEEKHVISGTDLNEINVFDDDGTVKTLRGHEGHVNALSINQKTNQLISAASDGTIKFWNMESWENLRTIRAHQNSIKSLILNEDGEFLFSYSKTKQTNEIKVWNLTKGIKSMGNLTKFESNKMLQCTIINDFNVKTNGTFNFAINNIKELLTAPYSQPLNIWNYERGVNLNTFNLDVDDKSEISKLLITKNNKIIVGYENGIIRVWV
jgi:WD40 repeat protein